MTHIPFNVWSSITDCMPASHFSISRTLQLNYSVFHSWKFLSHTMQCWLKICVELTRSICGFLPFPTLNLLRGFAWCWWSVLIYECCWFTHPDDLNPQQELCWKFSVIVFSSLRHLHTTIEMGIWHFMKWIIVFETLFLAEILSSLISIK